ncbi:S-adenosyl-L-methionine-dependent methyltransferase [Pisolithus orientalis]|uniref:S-adenosyl-L-methionine-dependent methyltransferase n=1 Tax=Pisolithus orientalis TaxID=936130 RepID=UPI002224053A|nr:S-adenosyl-L-methionine-dependent methyltransferase [Pisolithus orientalis]KAI6032835.1 S-adenosyl-L-methionine-dependent methyltransferase [Pisolithus orientalis]
MHKTLAVIALIGSTLVGRRRRRGGADLLDLMRSPSGNVLSQLPKKLASLLGCESARLELKWMKESLRPSDHPSTLQKMVERRLQGEPLQYILGTTPFGPLSLLCRPPTLIPRPETEDWTLRLANTISPKSSRPLSVLDLCTGSGCIPLLLCHLWPPGSTRAFGVDISKQAIKLATDNAARCNIPAHSGADSLCNVFVPVLGDFRDTKFLKKLGAPFDVVTANPPYIPEQEYDQLSPSVKDYEDPRALLGDLPESPIQNGLSFYHLIARFLAEKGILRNGATVALEVGDRQAEAVENILHCSAGLRHTEIWTDPWGKQRVVLARV